MLIDMINFYNEIKNEYGNIITDEAIEILYKKINNIDFELDSDMEKYEVPKTFNLLYDGMYNCEVICKIKTIYKNDKYNKLILEDNDKNNIELVDFNKYDYIDNLKINDIIHLKNIRCSINKYNNKKTLYTTNDSQFLLFQE